MYTFVLPDNVKHELIKWCKEQDAKVARIQKNKFPNYGAIGGGYTYNFTPTGLGIISKVTNAITHEELDLTDYDAW